MYLSRLFLNPRSYQVRRDLGSHQDLHRTVLSLFPQLPPDAGRVDARQHFGVLHRLDSLDGTGALTLLIQSAVEPDLARLPVDYILPNPPSGSRAAECKPLTERYRHINAGRRLAFRLKANPTRKIDTKSGPDGKRRNGKRVDLRTEEQWQAWLARKGEDGGFRLLSVHANRPVKLGQRVGPPPPGGYVALSAVPNVRVQSESRQWGVRRPPSPGLIAQGRDRLTFASVIFEGILEVTDADQFRATLANGIGSAKAYGFGLMSIAPVAPVPAGGGM